MTIAVQPDRRDRSSREGVAHGAAAPGRRCSSRRHEYRRERNRASSRNARDSSPNDSIVSAGRCANGCAAPTVWMRAMKRPSCSSVARCSSSGARPPCRAKIAKRKSPKRCSVRPSMAIGGTAGTSRAASSATSACSSRICVIAPARRAVELRDHRRRVVAPSLVDAILVAVERDQPAVAAHADAVERVEHAIGGESRVGRASVVSIHVANRLRHAAILRGCCTVPRGGRRAKHWPLRWPMRSAQSICYCSSFRATECPSLMQISAATDRIAQPMGRRHRPSPRRLHPHSREVAAFRSATGRRNGHIERVIRLAEEWARAQPIPGLTVEIVRLAGTHAGAAVRSARQPTTGPCCSTGTSTSSPRWSAGATTADRGRRSSRTASSIGRGGADDGYAIFSALSALGALRRRACAHARCVGLIETCEESGSYDLPAYLDALQAAARQRRSRHRPRLRLRRLRTPVDDDVAARARRRQADGRGADRGRALRRCERRRAVVVSHRAQAPRPSRGLGERLDHCRRPFMRRFHRSAWRRQRAAAAILGDIVFRKYPFSDRHAADDRRRGRSAAESNVAARRCPIIGADGLPAIANAGNVLRPKTALELSLRLPPLVDGHARDARR